MSHGAPSCPEARPIATVGSMRKDTSPWPGSSTLLAAGGTSVVEPRQTFDIRFASSALSTPCPSSWGVQRKRVGVGGPRRQPAIGHPSCSVVPRRKRLRRGQQRAGPAWPWDGGFERTTSCRPGRRSIHSVFSQPNAASRRDAAMSLAGSRTRTSGSGPHSASSSTPASAPTSSAAESCGPPPGRSAR